jgi:hypothetical protein
MSVIEDVRKVFQDLVAPELKSISVKLDGFERESKLRDENLALESKLRDEITQAKIELVRDSLSAKMDALGAKMEAQYASIMNALDLNRRVETLERDKQSASA